MEAQAHRPPLVSTPSFADNFILRRNKFFLQQQLHCFLSKDRDRETRGNHQNDLMHRTFIAPHLIRDDVDFRRVSGRLFRQASLSPFRSLWWDARERHRSRTIALKAISLARDGHHGPWINSVVKDLQTGCINDSGTRLSASCPGSLSDKLFPARGFLEDFRHGDIIFKNGF
jgi:hypothetical protein